MYYELQATSCKFLKVWVAKFLELFKPQLNQKILIEAYSKHWKAFKMTFFHENWSLKIDNNCNSALDGTSFNGVADARKSQQCVMTKIND